MPETRKGIVLRYCKDCRDFHVGWQCGTVIEGRECGTVSSLTEKWCRACGTECPREVALIATLTRTVPLAHISTQAKN